MSLSLRHSLSKFVYALLPYWNLNDDQHDCREDKSFKCQEWSQSFDTENALNLHVKCASYRGAAKWGILYIYLSIYVSIIIYLCIYLSTYLSIFLYLIVYSSQSVCLSVYLLICLSVCFSIFFSISIEAEKRAEQRFFATCASQVHPPLKGRLSWTDWRTSQGHHEFICLSSNVSYWQKKVLKSSAVSEMSGFGRICQLLAPGNLHF